MVAYKMPTPSASTGKMLGGKNMWEGAATINKRRRRHQENAAVQHWIWLELGECDPDPYWLDDPYWHGGWEHELGPMSGISCS